MFLKKIFFILSISLWLGGFAYIAGAQNSSRKKHVKIPDEFYLRQLTPRVAQLTIRQVYEKGSSSFSHAELLKKAEEDILRALYICTVLDSPAPQTNKFFESPSLLVRGTPEQIIHFREVANSLGISESTTIQFIERFSRLTDEEILDFIKRIVFFVYKRDIKKLDDQSLVHQLRRDMIKVGNTVQETLQFRSLKEQKEFELQAFISFMLQPCTLPELNQKINELHKLGITKEFFFSYLDQAFLNAPHPLNPDGSKHSKSLHDVCLYYWDLLL